MFKNVDEIDLRMISAARFPIVLFNVVEQLRKQTWSDKPTDPPSSSEDIGVFVGHVVKLLSTIGSYYLYMPNMTKFHVLSVNLIFTLLESSNFQGWADGSGLRYQQTLLHWPGGRVEAGHGGVYHVLEGLI